MHNGFYTTAIGKNSDKIYGLALCTGHLSSQECYNCINNTNHNLVSFCPNKVEGFFTDGCMTRYSNRSFYGELELSPNRQLYNTGNITTNMDDFDAAWENLTETLIIKASMGSSTRKFATGETITRSFSTIYYLMQCTPDLSQSNCDYCLRQAAGNYQKCCHGKRGGVSYTPSCMLRWDLYPFYTYTDNAAPPRPPLPPPSPVIVPPPLPNNAEEGGRKKFRIAIIVIIPTIIVAMLILSTFALIIRIRMQKLDINDEDAFGTAESLLFELSTIRAATDDFSEANKLGQGGFGSVYRGKLKTGQEIAVKRLAENSVQGKVEFKNEIVLMAKLEHKNLVRLLGFCFKGGEKLLIYEYVPNSSLDRFIYDEKKRRRLDWEMRYNIIVGIARGTLYLHEGSPVRIIHRDLKPGNVLLDGEMNAKISDFGMARLFKMDQSKENTRRIAGTFGYMPPEYTNGGMFSMKSDVFSFGVIMLEILTGEKNTSFRKSDSVETVVSYVWENWRENKALSVIDKTLRKGSKKEMLRCIHIGLLCVQEM